jgi:hypothetical protein
MPAKRRNTPQDSPAQSRGIQVGNIDTTDAERGMAWWNSPSRFDRTYWLGLVNSAVPVAAWQAFKAHIASENGQGVRRS